MTTAKDTEQILEFPDGVIAELYALRQQDWRRGVIRTVDKTPVQVVRIIDAQTNKQRRRDGKFGWETRGSNVNLYYNGFQGEYRPGTRILTSNDPTRRHAKSRRA